MDGQPVSRLMMRWSKVSDTVSEVTILYYYQAANGYTKRMEVNKRYSQAEFSQVVASLQRHAPLLSNDVLSLLVSRNDQDEGSVTFVAYVPEQVFQLTEETWAMVFYTICSHLIGSSPRNSGLSPPISFLGQVSLLESVILQLRRPLDRGEGSNRLLNEFHQIDHEGRFESHRYNFGI